MCSKSHNESNWTTKIWSNFKVWNLSIIFTCTKITSLFSSVLTIDISRRYYLRSFVTIMTMPSWDQQNCNHCCQWWPLPKSVIATYLQITVSMGSAGRRRANLGTKSSRVQLFIKHKIDKSKSAYRNLRMLLSFCGAIQKLTLMDVLESHI